VRGLAGSGPERGPGPARLRVCPRASGERLLTRTDTIRVSTPRVQGRIDKRASKGKCRRGTRVGRRRDRRWWGSL